MVETFRRIQIRGKSRRSNPPGHIRMLAPSAHIYVHLDYRLSHYARVLLDELLGIDAYRNEIVWKRSNPKNDPKQYGRIHDTLLYYAGDESEYYPVYGDYREEYVEQAYRHRDPDGRTIWPASRRQDFC